MVRILITDLSKTTFSTQPDSPYSSDESAWSHILNEYETVADLICQNHEHLWKQVLFCIARVWCRISFWKCGRSKRRFQNSALRRYTPKRTRRFPAVFLPYWSISSRKSERCQNTEGYYLLKLCWHHRNSERCDDTGSKYFASYTTVSGCYLSSRRERIAFAIYIRSIKIGTKNEVFLIGNRIL